MATRRTRTPSRRPAKRPAARRPGRRAENKEATRQRIVSAALALFQTKGFEGTTTREIARRAKIAEGTVFNYFRTKEDIALHFFEQELDHAIATVRGDKRLRKAALEEKLFALVQAQLDFLSPYEKFIWAAFVQALRPTSKLNPLGIRSQQLHLRYIAFVQELIEESLPKRSLPGFEVWAAPAFWVLYLGVLLYWLRDTSEGKQHTLAFLDRMLKVAVQMLTRPER